MPLVIMLIQVKALFLPRTISTGGRKDSSPNLLAWQCTICQLHYRVSLKQNWAMARCRISEGTDQRAAAVWLILDTTVAISSE